ncbi:hypothetical protein DFR29_103202 [Tahibacter aquaticus]|uniref:Uncharacterized protein n=1 Tax=Tahibacter aquaticus TaxID=520092 RepID=A0A4V3DN07_9GAMM|nr:hypothetical protein [Tahibacter aquaticus]TDR46666.1 hypothetical protein DFR29_103202 [Tahibacter aquaticus]
MSDRQPPTVVNHDLVGSALRALPPAAAPAGGWEALAASLRAAGLAHGEDDAPTAAVRPHPAPRRPHQRAAGRRWIPAALAAGLGLLALSLVPLNRPAPATQAGSGNPPAAIATAASDDKTELAQLRGESARIEEWLRTLRADETPLDGRSLMAATEIEDMIGLIDLQLAAGNDAGSDARVLWHNRVELLRDLAAVRTTFSLAGTGIAANGTAAVPDNWTTL